MSDIKPEILELAKKLEKAINVSKDGSTTVDENVYKEYLEEGVKANLSKTLAEKVTNIAEILEAEQKYKSSFIAAAGHAFGGKSIDVMKKHNDISQTNMNISTIGKDSLDFVFKREVPVPNPGGEGTKVSYGSLQVKANTYSAGNRGQLAKVKQDLSERAQSAFGG